MVLCKCHIMPTVSSWSPVQLFNQDDQKDMQHEILVMWWHWCQHQNYVMSMASLHLFSKDNQNQVLCWYWCWHHMMQMASSLASLHSLHQDNWNEMHHDLLDIWFLWHWHQFHIMPKVSSMAQLHSLCFCHVMPLTSTLAWHDATGIGVSVMWCNCTGVSIMMSTAPRMAPLYSLCQDNQNEVHHDFLFMWHHWYQPCYHMMPTVLSMALFPFGQDDQK